MSAQLSTRRRFLKDAAAAAAGAATLGALAAPPANARRRRPARQTVAIIGGGVAGLTAAHELIERGFDVTVYERRAWGGKARSTNVPGSARGGRRPLPGEHAFRFVFAGYQNLPDTMRRIPFGSNPSGVFDNLVQAPQIDFARDRGRADFTLPLLALDPRGYTLDQIHQTLLGSLQLAAGIPPNEVAYLAQRLVVYFSSGLARRLGEWEQISWADFIGADRCSEDYRKVFSDALCRQTIAAKSHTASARTIGNGFESVIYLELTGRGTSKILNLPTNEAWINPWTNLLRDQGVKLRLGHTITGLETRDGRIVGAHAIGPHGRHQIHADWYVLAVPVERARQLWTPEILAADPQLGRMNQLQTAWMNGIQFYLRQPTPIATGFVLYVDSPWALESVNQAELWTSRDFARDYGDGRAREDLSVAICDWTTPGVIYGKPARDCTPSQIAHEVWDQMKRHLNDTRQPVLTDDLLLSWHLDPGIITRHGHIVADEDPLVTNSVGSWTNRPTANTGIPNLLLAGDYVQADFDITSMETANEAARRAVNALLDHAGSTTAPCHVFPRNLPPEWNTLRALDDDRYQRGQANVLESPLPATELDSLLTRLSNL